MIDKAVRGAIGEVLGNDGRQVIKHYHKLQAENELLKAQINSLREAISTKNKQKQQSKPLFAQLRAEQGNVATFFSPQKIREAR
jgi:cell division septum initiation protein DivIVA